jgi:hypothetical protein
LVIHHGRDAAGVSLVDKRRRRIILHAESAAFAIDRKYPESDHAPVATTFDF